MEAGRGKRAAREGQGLVRNAAYEERLQAMGWPDLTRLFADIKARATTTTREPGKALEHLVPRMFQLEGAKVRWPYGTKLQRDVVELQEQCLVAAAAGA